MSRVSHTNILRSLQRTTCPTCHQPIQPLRFGIAWPPVKAAILGLLARRGEAGADTAEILDAVYADRKRPQPQCVKSHVGQINDIFETEAPQWRIVRDDGR
jgi:hypothetical protein